MTQCFVLSHSTSQHSHITHVEQLSWSRVRTLILYSGDLKFISGPGEWQPLLKFVLILLSHSIKIAGAIPIIRTWLLPFASFFNSLLINHSINQYYTAWGTDSIVKRTRNKYILHDPQWLDYVTLFCQRSWIEIDQENIHSNKYRKKRWWWWWWWQQWRWCWWQ